MSNEQTEPVEEVEDQLTKIATNVFTDRIPFWPDLHICAATISSQYQGRIDVAGVGRSRAMAVRSAMGEAVETLSQDLRASDPVQIVDPSQTKLGGWLAMAPETVRCKILLAHEPVLGQSFAVPAAFVLRGVADWPEGPPISEGSAAGATFQEAQLSAALELIERDAVARWWRGGRPARCVESGLMDRPGANPRRVFTLDIGSDALAPVVAMISLDARSDGFVFAAAARPSFAEARAAAVRELAQMELGEAILRRSPKRVLADSPAGKRMGLKDAASLIGPILTNLHTSNDLPVGEATETLQYLLQAARDRNVRFGFVDITRAEFGLSVAKAVSPNLEPSRVPALSSELKQLRLRWGAPNPARNNLEVY